MAQELIKAAAQIFNADPMAENRKRKNADARFAVFAALRQRGMHLKEIGRIFNKRAHATIMHGLKMHAILMETDSVYRKRYERLTFENKETNKRRLHRFIDMYIDEAKAAEIVKKIKRGQLI